MGITAYKRVHLRRVSGVVCRKAKNASFKDINELYNNIEFM